MAANEKIEALERALSKLADASEPLRHEVVAFNYAVDSDNKIHDDEVAATYGFEGGLVPGVAVLAYMSRPVAEELGEEWLAAGRLSGKFLRPAYEGDRVVATATPEDGGLTLELRDSSGGLCAVGRADACATPRPAAEQFAVAALPATKARHPPNAADIPVGEPVGSLDLAEAAAASGVQVAERYPDDLALYTRDGAPLHPAFLADEANTLLGLNVALGPWIHTQSEIRFHELVRPAEDLSLRGSYRAAYEKRGHHIVELELAAVSDGRVVAEIDHVAIVRPRLKIEATSLDESSGLPSGVSS